MSEEGRERMKVRRTHPLKVDRARAWITSDSRGQRQLEVHLWSGPELFRLILADRSEAAAFIHELVVCVSAWVPSPGSPPQPSLG